MFPFLLKKILGVLLMPLPMATIGVLLSLILFRKKKKKTARAVMSISLLATFLLSLPAISYQIGAPLERAYPQYDGTPVVFVAVHGGYHSSDSAKPITSWLSSISMVRLMEGIRIYQLNPGSKLLLSGYSGQDKISQAETMARVAESFGVPRSDMVLEPKTKDTEEEAIAWSKYVKGAAFAVVTSAIHMPRTMMWYQEYGAMPIPAPTEYKYGGDGEIDWWGLIPSARALRSSESAWYEYLGVVWAHIKKSFS